MKIMDSLDEKCNKLKHAYDSCFNAWFSEHFLKGGPASNSTPCEAMLKAYSDCVKEAMRARNMDPVLYAKHWEEFSFPEAGTAKYKEKGQDVPRKEEGHSKETTE